MKFRCVLPFLCLSISLSGQQLEDYQWKNRLIVLIDKSENKAKMQQQLAYFEDDLEGLKERKILVFQFDGIQLRKGKQSGKHTEKDELLVNLNKKVNADTDFSTFLIGLDGGVKAHWSEPVVLSTIYSLIDKMPMRRAEIRRKKGVN